MTTKPTLPYLACLIYDGIVDTNFKSPYLVRLKMHFTQHTQVSLQEHVQAAPNRI